MPAYLTHSPIDVTTLVASVASEGCGASVLFLGSVRRSPEDGEVTAIDYSAYADMAEAEFDRIVTEAVGRWPGARIGLRHRLGLIPVGEASIAIAVACPHRAEAYEVSRYVIEETKKRVPIWKKEQHDPGEQRWVKPAERIHPVSPPSTAHA